MLFVLIVALIVADLLASRVAESAYADTLRRELESKGRLLADVSAGNLSAAGVRSASRSAGARITVIAADGAVVADSEADSAQMENHRGRPEVAEALAGRAGSSIRESPTMGVRFLYVAVPYSSGVIRFAVPLSQIDAQVNMIRRQVMISTALAFLPAILIAAMLARSVSSRLARIIDYAGELAKGNFQVRLDSQGGDELAVLSGKLNEMGQKLERTVGELERERAEIERVERIRKDFVINVSHELRTPLASIQGYTETLLDGALDDSENNIRFLKIIRQNAERLGRLVSDLLTLSRLELGTQKLEPGICDVHSLLAESVESLRPVAEKKGLRIQVSEPLPPVTAFCDLEAVHQVLGNLLDNALKYTPAGGEIAVGARLRGESAIEVFVCDTGIGIPQEELPRLFERFYRVDKARSRQLGGTGLGLSIVKHLVQAMGGEVRVESEPGKGSVFSFTVPAAGGVKQAVTGLSPKCNQAALS